MDSQNDAEVQDRENRLLSSQPDADIDSASVVSHGSARSVSSIDKMMNNMAKLAALEASKKFIDMEAEENRRAKQLSVEKEAAIALAELQVYRQYATECGIGAISQSIPTAGLFSLISQPKSSISISRAEEPLTKSTDVMIGSLSQTSRPVTTSRCTQLRADAPVFSTIQQPLMSTSLAENLQGSQAFIPVQTYSGDSAIHRDEIITALTRAYQNSQLPKIELEKFSGNSTDFYIWMSSFEKLIEESTYDPVRRLHYLRQYTTGRANLLVSGFCLDQTEAGYSAAKRELIKEFGNPYVIARSYLKRIESWKNISPQDMSGLKSFCTLLKTCKGSMATMKHLQQLNTDLYLQKIVSKLPTYMQASWRKHVFLLESNQQDVNFYELTDFIDEQCQVGSHPVFSSEALNNSYSSVLKTHGGLKGVKVSAMTKTISQEQGQSQNSSQRDYEFKKTCPKCKGEYSLQAIVALLLISPWKTLDFPSHIFSQLIANGSTMFLVIADYEISRDIYEYAKASLFWLKLNFSFQLLALGRSSMVTKCVGCKPGETVPLISTVYKQILVDYKSRKSCRIPQAILESYNQACIEKIEDIQPQLKIPAEPEKNAFRHSFIIRYSDLDRLQHLTHPKYLALCMDTAAVAAFREHFSYFSKDFGRYRAKRVRCCHLSECLPNHTIDSFVWEDDVEIGRLNFLFKKGDTRCFYASMTFYDMSASKL